MLLILFPDKSVLIGICWYINVNDDSKQRYYLNSFEKELTLMIDFSISYLMCGVIYPYGLNGSKNINEAWAT